MDEKRHLKRKEKALQDGNREQLAICCNVLGDYYNEQGRYQDAANEYKQETEIYTKLKKSLALARAHRMVGEMHMLLSEFESAKEHINLYLKSAKKLQNKVEEQRAYATLGRVHLLHGQSSGEMSAATVMTELKQAERAFLRSLLLIKELTGQISKLEQLDMQARCYLNIGVVKEHMEQFDESIEYIEKAIKISKSHDIFELTHLCYISMSLLYQYKQNNATLALRYCNLALEVAKRLPNRVKKICETLMTKAEILIKEGDFASAKQILTKAYKKHTPDENDRSSIEKLLQIVVKICQILDELVTTSSIDFTKRKMLYEKLGDGCCQLQNYKKALEFYQQMLDSAELSGESGKVLMPIYVSLYQTYKDNKEYDKALEYLWKEFELNKDIADEACLTLCGIAEIYELQQQPFWTVQGVYQRAKEQAAKVESSKAKLEQIVYVRLKRLQLKHNMHVLADDLTEEAKSKGIDLESLDDDCDTETGSTAAPTDIEQNTPQLGDDVCLDELTDSDMSDLDETEKPRPHRATRGTRGLAIKRNNKGETQLHQACITGNVELVRRLLDQGHVVNVRDHAGWIPLHEACNHGYRDIVELLLDKGAVVAINDKGGTSCDGITPLYDACANGYLDVVELLLEHGADATLKTDFGETCVDGLDKWRRTATLTEGEQAQYAQTRATLLKPLSKLGISKATKLKPLTNANFDPDTKDEEDEALISESNECDADCESRNRGEFNRSGSRSRIPKDTNKTASRNTAASTEYRHVMEQLKRPNRLSSVESEVYSTSPSSCNINNTVNKQKRTALLDTEEIDDADWLVNDVGPEKKRRRFVMPIVDTSTTTTTAAMMSTSKSISKENLLDNVWAEDYLEHTPETDAFQVLLEAAGSSSSSRQREGRKLRLSRSSSISSHSSLPAAGTRTLSKMKQQTSLLENGFCRFRSDSPLTSEESTDGTAFHMRTTEHEPDSTTMITAVQDSTMKLQRQLTPVQPTTVSFKVKVEDELLLVPIERKKLHEINMRWLAEEASRRYYNLVGLRPTVRLKTADGFAYEENDAVNVALEQNMILATVLEWHISPLAQRYAEMCQQLKKDVNADVQSMLERAQSSNVINLHDFWLTPTLMEPISRALLHQSNLRVLELSNNFMQNDGCRQLAKSLPTLKQLQILNLKGNFITADGLKSICSCAGLEQLEELNLSQNPLGNECIHLLAGLCEGATGKTLQKLFLSQCQLMHLPNDLDLCYHQLSTFDISYNQLNDQSMRLLLTKLNSCRLQQLNLSYATLCKTHGDRIASFFESGTCEKFKRIALAGCGLGDAAVYRIVQCLVKANDLEVFEVTDNIQLNATSAVFIIEKLPQLRQLIAVNCKRFIDDERLQHIAEFSHLPNVMSVTLQDDATDVSKRLSALWQTHWGERARIQACTSAVNQLLLYVQDKELQTLV